MCVCPGVRGESAHSHTLWLLLLVNTLSSMFVPVEEMLGTTGCLGTCVDQIWEDTAWRASGKWVSVGCTHVPIFSSSHPPILPSSHSPILPFFHPPILHTAYRDKQRVTIEQVRVPALSTFLFFTFIVLINYAMPCSLLSASAKGWWPLVDGESVIVLVSLLILAINTKH